MIKWPSTCTCCGNPIIPCPDGDLGIWVANDNQQRDDNFEVRVNGVFINDILGGRANLLLGYDNYSGHLILPEKFSAFDKSQCEFPAALPPTPAMTDFVAGGVHTRLIFSSNTPVVAGETLYSILLKNIQNNNNGNLGTLYLFQVCEDPTDGHPVMKYIIGQGTYSGPSGADIAFNFTTNKCTLCTGDLCEHPLALVNKTSDLCQDYNVATVNTVTRFVFTDSYYWHSRFVLMADPTDPCSLGDIVETGVVLNDTGPNDPHYGVGCGSRPGVYDFINQDVYTVLRIAIQTYCLGGVHGEAWNMSTQCFTNRWIPLNFQYMPTSGYGVGIFAGPVAELGNTLVCLMSSPSYSIAVWDGWSWAWHSTAGYNNFPRNLVKDGNVILVCCDYSFQVWDGSVLSTIGSLQSVRGGCIHNGQYIAACLGNGYGSSPLFDGGIYQWNGSVWNNLWPAMMRLPVYSAVSFGGNLYAGSVYGIHRWNGGTTWTHVLAVGPVRCFCVHGGALYASGDSGIFVFNGASWAQVVNVATNKMVSTALGIAYYTAGGVYLWDLVNAPVAIGTFPLGAGKQVIGVDVFGGTVVATSNNTSTVIESGVTIDRRIMRWVGTAPFLPPA
jgi:hypothetical protein